MNHYLTFFAIPLTGNAWYNLTVDASALPFFILSAVAILTTISAARDYFAQ